MLNTLSASALLHRYRIVLVTVRAFLGIVYLSNGLAKLFSLHSLTIGPWKSYLINRTDALGIQRSNTVKAPGFLHDLGNVVVDHWDVLQWLLTVGEISVGLGLILGLLSQVSAAGGFILAFSTFVFALGSGVWTYDYLFEPVILLALVFAPGLPGLDSRLPWGRLRGTKDTTAPIRQ
ncbi:MAG: DoxX family membrane protein [Candidatus Dormibacteraeota bacterium]|uniref:DoxX family membrane protein n=1 Tax=Candidatus Amunia macphersoniae TaxID=3127014 RepID=A0A934KH85_9BACT|nr:DoxX family membrane protein [Candidatus Dormibacteraeota bacterium]